MWLQNGRTKNELSVYLWKRGLWLVLLEITAFRVVFAFSLSGTVLLTILWAIGWSMVPLGFLSRLPLGLLSAFSILMIALHNLADSIPSPNLLWRILHQPGPVALGPLLVVVGYPLIPWIAVMSAGFCFGRVLLLDPEVRQRWLLRVSIGLIVAFLVLRAVNVYGDPQPWTSLTLPSFLRTTKYPPSLQFLLMTLGPALLALRGFYVWNVSRRNPLVVMGRVPLFYFLGHFLLIHVLAILIGGVVYGWAGIPWNPLAFAVGYGYPLWVAYAAWALVVGLMYPLCRWYGEVKQRSQSAWLAYL